MADFETVVGLEVHVELKTRSKIFCSCPTAFGADPNAHVCEVCLGLPGALPRLNKRVPELAVMTALALHAKITPEMRFDRKNYFYPDLPKGYQISQLYAPVARNGYLDVETGEGENAYTRQIRIHELHMEDDAGKLVHDALPDQTCIDYSRCGVPLIEIVTEPDFRNADEVVAFLQKLRTLLQFLDVSDCKMQEGSMRVDVNLSVRPVGQEELGTRTEMKNLSSFRAVSKAVEYEARRQWACLLNGEEIVRETRRWDEDQEVSLPMRKKEDAAEYKYFPEPDLPKIRFTEEKIEEIRKALSETPDEKKKRYIGQMHLPPYDAGILTSGRRVAALFERTAELCGDPKESSNWIMGEFMKILNDHGVGPEDFSIREDSLGEIIVMLKENQVSRASAKALLLAAYEEGAVPEEYAKEHDLRLVRDKDTLLPIVEKVLEENPKPLAEYRAGKVKNKQFLLGQAMRSTKGKADPAVLAEVLQECLDRL